MTDHKELFLFGRAVPGKSDENAFIERVIDAANNRNRNGSKTIKAISSIPANDIEQIVVGQSSIGFLFSDKRIARLNFEIVENVVSAEEKTPSSLSTSAAVDVGSSNVGSTQPGSSGLGSGTGSSSSQPPIPTGFGTSSSSAANRTAKIRRMMIAARRPGAICGRTGVIVDRTRTTLPASSVPEELIAQAQVVLQGKSRDVIVRELQRTSLNVNEAVNNLLSRDDDEDDLDEAGEYLHEELLSLLDAGLRGEGGAAVIEGDSLYSNAEGYEYLIGQDRRRAEQKSKERKSETTAPTEVTQENFKFADELQFWHDVKGQDFPSGVKEFTKISATYSSLHAIANNGKIYTWDWKSDLPSNKPHSISEKLTKEDADEKIVDFEACAWRVTVLTNKNRVASFVDDYCGETLGSAFYTGFIDLPSGVTVERLLVCPLYSAILTTNNKIFWWGVYPFVDRIQMFENVKKKSQDTTNKAIVVGSEVRTRAIPIYANGSVGVNFSSGVPLIGVLMESVWTMTETCRFRVFTPDQYAIYVKECGNQSEDKTPADLNQRKRSAPSGNSKSTTTAQYKEDAWCLRQVTFFYEEPVCDTAVVKIMDGTFVGIVYKSAIEKNESENNGVVDEIQLLKNSMRLMRKDELIVVPTTKISRSPQIHQRKLTEIKIPKRITRILSAVIDNNCFRILAEKSVGEVSLITTNGNGTDVTDQHLPVDLSVLSTSRDKNCLALENYGDDDLLVLRDASGSIVPLIPDSTNGFREPSYIGFGPSKHLSVGLRFITPTDISCSLVTSNSVLDTKLLRKSETSKSANRLLLLATLVAPEPRTTEPKIDSLIQNIQFCDLTKVNQILSELEESADENERRFQILESYTDGGRNIFHTAVMNAFSATNRDQGDDYTGVKVDESGNVNLEGGSLFETAEKPKKDAEQSSTTNEADAVSMKFDQRWKEMISSEPTLSKIMSSSPSSSTKNSSSRLSKEKDPSPMEEDRRKDQSSFSLSPRQRQKNAIQIISTLASSNVVKPYLLDLMKQRDLNGYTPFYGAIQMRAYSAAMLMWSKMYELEKEAGRANPENLSNLAFSGVGNDSVLFLLCYNDVCSFTWTGEEHINQDIFECKTCDLVGSLCACTECAFSCHRDHDCKLKRTSPTAYCDCWEKSACRALVAGNQTQRENLLTLLIQHTNLISLMNSRSEHLLLFLARTVGRQLVEQENFPRRNKIRSSQAAGSSSNGNNLTVPEHNLEPPKFAITALLSLLGRWNSVKSLLKVGMKEKNLAASVSEDVFHLNEQHGSSHLDRFIFTLLARCPETALDALLNTLIREANKAGSDRDSEIDEMISRFVRSIVRLFSFLCISSQYAMNSILTLLGTEIGEATGAPKHQLSSSVSTQTAAKNLLPSYRTITVSGVLSLVRTSLPISLGGSSSKENKKKQINNFVLKCRRVFQVLITHSITELLNSSDSLIAPVRLGIAKQGVSIHRCTGTSDPLEYIEKYLYSENEYSVNGQKSTKHKRGRFRNAAANADEEHNSEDSDASDSETPTQRRSLGNTFASNIAENVAENAITEAFRDAGAQENANDDQNNDLSDDSNSISASEQDEDEMNHQHELDQSEGSGDEDHEHYMEEGDEHYFRIEDEDVIDESADDYTEDDDEHYSSEGEHSPMYDQSEQPPFDEVSELQAQPTSARNATGSGSQRRKHSRRHRRSTTNQSDQQGNEGEQPMEQDESSTISVGQNAEQPARTGQNNDQGSSTANAETNQSSAAADNSTNRTGETSSRSQPRTISTFRTLFTTESASPSRTTNAGQTSYTTQSPSIGWAVRRVRQQNDESSADNGNLASNGERTQSDNNNTESATIASSSRHIKSSSRHHYNSSENDVFQTKIQLSATFSLLVKMVDELLLRLIQHEAYAKQSHTGITQLLELGSISEVSTNFKNVINERISVTWEWFEKIMDKIEVMLRFGNALLKSPVGTEISPDMHSAASLSQSRNEKHSRKKTDRKDEHSSSNKREFFGYFMSLQRASSNENGDQMPLIDPNPYRHVALVAEAYLFHMQITELIESKLKALCDDVVVETQPTEVDENISGKEIRRFYRRSSSICYPSITHAESQHAFKYTASDTAPLATRSTLLKPETERSELFMLPSVERTVEEHINLARDHGFKHPTKMSVAEKPLRVEDVVMGVARDESMEVDSEEKLDEAELERNDLDAMFGIQINSTRLAMTKTLGRWGNAMSYLAKAFSEDIIEYSGNDSFNSLLLNELGGFLLKHSQFKAKMEKYKSGLTKDLNFSQLTRDKHNLIADVFVYLNNQYTRRTSNSSSNIDPTNLPPLGSNRVKAKFENEPGEGSGVVRSFYSAFSESIIEMDYLPREESSSGLNQSSSSSSRTSFQRNLEASQDTTKHLETLPLFARTNYGFLSPVPGNNSTMRKNAFRNVGRMIGLCLQQLEILPLPLCRHVLKFILNRPVTWYDLIFYDPDMFDSLRSIIYNESSNEPHNKDFYENLALSFVVDVPPSEGGGVVELKPGGEKIAVNRDNILEYVYLFVQKRLLGDHIPALEAMRQGVFDVIPADSLSGLTSEDLRLILCGTEQVSVRLLETFTTFMDESNCEAKMLAKIKNWFWRVVEKFTDKEKQDLLFFWTGSPSLPPTEEAFTPLPTVMVRPADDVHLVTANTCISRLYLPLYSSKKILKQKLLTSINCKDFGFV